MLVDLAKFANDDQVKLRGYRIELGEIEAALGSHPAVRQTAVVARTDAGNTRLIAYTVCVDGMDTTAAKLKSHLKARLPDYSRPALRAG